MTAVDALALELLELADRRLTTPCQGLHRDRWTSDLAGDREWAVHHCRPCPVLAACRAAAAERDERHHVWGVDRTPAPPARKRTTEGATR